MFMLTSVIQIDNNLRKCDARNVPGWSGLQGVQPDRPQAMPGLNSAANQSLAPLNWFWFHDLLRTRFKRRCLDSGRFAWLEMAGLTKVSRFRCSLSVQPT
jgi:hypothetical protein